MAIMPLSPLSHMKDAMQQVEVRLQAKRSEVKKHEKKAEAVAKEGMKLKEQLREIEEVHNKWLAYFDKGHVTAAQVTNGIAGTEGDEGEASSDTEVGTQLRKPV
jgi:predicted transcriptional regulator